MSRHEPPADFEWFPVAATIGLPDRTIAERTDPDGNPHGRIPGFVVLPGNGKCEGVPFEFSIFASGTTRVAFGDGREFFVEPRDLVEALVKVERFPGCGKPGHVASQGREGTAFCVTCEDEARERAQQVEVAIHRLAAGLWPDLHLHDGRVDGLRRKLAVVGLISEQDAGNPAPIRRCADCGLPERGHNMRHPFRLLVPLGRP